MSKSKRNASVAGGEDAAESTYENPFERLLQEQWEFLSAVLDGCRDEDGHIVWADVIASCRSEGETIERRVVESMAPHDAFDIVANMLFSNLPIDPESYSESEHEGLLALVEYSASLCLRRSERGGSGDRKDPTLGRGTEEWNPDLKRLLRLRGLAQLAHIAGDDSTLFRARYQEFEREMLLRNVAYDWQEEGMLRLLFGPEPTTTALQQRAGFDIEQALTIAESIGNWAVQQLASRAVATREETEGFRALIESQRSGQDVQGPSSKHQAILADLADMSGDEIDEIVDQFTGFSVWTRFGDTASFTTADLAARTSLPEGTVQAFLDIFSQGFGQAPENDPIRALQAVRARPIMRYQGRYLCVDAGDLLFALRPRLEDRLKKDPRAWTSYDRRRATVSEERSLELLASVLAPDATYHSLTWSDKGQSFELDGLLLVDRFLITIEAKAGGFTAPARRAAPDRLEHDLSKLIGEAHNQSKRARDALLSHTRFVDSQGDAIEFDPTQFEAVLPLVITLDDLGISPRVWELARSGFLESNEHHPTTMSLHDLELVCDILDRPGALLHYLKRRHDFNQLGGLTASEEADLVMYYLAQGLYLDRTQHRPPLVLPSLTDPLDAYYMHEHGIRQTPAPKPGLVLPPSTQRIVTGLEEIRPQGWSAAVCLLLDMHSDELAALDERIDWMLGHGPQHQEPHDVSMAFESLGTGLSIVTDPSGDPGILSEYVRVLSFKNKYINRCATWIGIGIHATRPEPFHFFVYDARAWERDEELEQAIASTSPQPSDND